MNTHAQRLGPTRRGHHGSATGARKLSAGIGIRVKERGRSRRRGLPRPFGPFIWEMSVHGTAAITMTSTSIPGRQKSVVRQARTGGFTGSTHSFQTEL